MKFVRFGPAGHERPGIVAPDGQIRDLSTLVADFTGDALDPERLRRLTEVDVSLLPPAPSNVRIGPCVTGVGKFVCIGLNYADHAAETNAPIPEEPIVFMKATSAICGPNDDVVQPRDSTKLDWEVELGIVIGRTAHYVDEASALDHVAGYCVINDISERAFQLERGGTWDKGKGCDTFGPIGPWLVMPDEAGDVTNLSMWLSVNGKRYQNGSTRTMIFKPAFLISYLSRFMSLHPGDVISTGTPPGVGLGQKPPVYLSPGDVMELGIEHLGSQRQRVVSWRKDA